MYFILAFDLKFCLGLEFYGGNCFHEECIYFCPFFSFPVLLLKILIPFFLFIFKKTVGPDGVTELNINKLPAAV